MSQPKDLQKEIKDRLEKIQEHLNEIRKNNSNADILPHSQAIQKSLKEIDFLILDNHLKSSSINSVKKGKELEAIKEAIEGFKKSKFV